MDQSALVRSIREGHAFPSVTQPVTLIETHISYVLLTGGYAYKIKKAVNLQFLDFTTLEARRRYCDEEIRLNRVTAPSIYLEVIPITGTVAAPVIGGGGPVLEYAVKMRQFDQEGLLSRMLARGALTPAHIDQLAATVARFHDRAPHATAELPYGYSDDVLQPAQQNFEQLLAVVDDAPDRSDLESLRTWTAAEHATSLAAFNTRRRDGFVRECHGDLHLGNICLIEGEVTLFDRIEFNESMRWIDVMNDVAFVVTDLQERSRPDLAARFLTAYLDATGDYDGLAVLRFYLVYRSMVRAKVARLRVGQVESPEERGQLLAEYRAYLAAARRQSDRRPGAILITHGLPGSGKTTIAQSILECTGAIRLRTDIERKRLHHLDAGAQSHSAVGAGLYTPQASEDTYAHVCRLVRSIVQAGYIAIVDGAFLKKHQRDMLRHVAAALGLPFLILSVSAPPATLRERIMGRTRRGGDASEATPAVLEQLRRTEEALTPEERPFVVSCETGTSPPPECARAVVRALARRATADSPGSADN
jgi:aminoglycoside phosphotransferase family enzyme/predicted kinase